MPDSASPAWQAGIQAAPGQALDISVVVPTCKRPDLLSRCLEALLKQNFEPWRYEIIVCDDGPDDATRRLVERAAAIARGHGPRIEYVAVTATQGPAGARNCGWRRAQAPLIAFTDDDTLPDRGWLRAGWRAMKPAISAAAGRIVVPLPPRPTDYDKDAAGLATAEFVTANCFVRRTVLEQVGGFDERYTSAWREDSDLQFAIIAAGGAIVRAESALVIHPVRPGRWGISMSQQKKSQFDALLRRKYPELYQKRIRSSPPWLYYLILLSLAGAIAGALLGNLAVTLTGIAGWALLTGVFACKRLRGNSLAPGHVAEMIVTSMAIPLLSIFWRIYGACKFGVRLR